MTVRIRPEAPRDEASISEVTRRAFSSHPHSSQTEQFIITALREAGALTISLVAELAGPSGHEIVGHIAFSPVEISDGSEGWFGLGPVAVSPDHQGRGIGSALVEAGLDILKSSGAAGCVLAGDPGFYERFGFRTQPGLELPGMPPEYFLALPLGGVVPVGSVTYHPGFYANGIR